MTTTSLRGKHVLVTGGSSGIGLAVARTDLAEGAHVTIASRSADKLGRAVADLGGDVEARELDVTNEAAVVRLLAAVGSVHHLVTAASAAVLAPALEMPMAAFRELVDSKLYGQFHVARHAAPHIAPGGSITFFSGTVTQKPIPGGTANAAVGAAAAAMARMLALELAPIRVNAVVPGVIDTPSWDSLVGEKAKPAMLSQIASSLPVRRVGTPDDVAQAVLFLMQCGFADGATVVVDGGHRLV